MGRFGGVPVSLRTAVWIEIEIEIEIKGYIHTLDASSFLVDWLSEPYVVFFRGAGRERV